MHECQPEKKSMLNWDLVVIAGVLAVDQLRNGVFLFLASLDVYSLVLLLGIAWYLRSKKFNLGSAKSLGNLGLFDGFFGKYDSKA